MSQNVTINVPSSPDTTGLRYRILDLEVDLPKMSHIYNLAAPIDNPAFVPRSPQALAQEFEPQAADQRRNQLIVKDDGEMMTARYGLSPGMFNRTRLPD